MNVYIARSIRGQHGHQDMLAYQTINEIVINEGHVPAVTLSPIPMKKETATDTFIYERDIDWINRSHLMIAEVSNPSLGVGYEIAYAFHVRHLPVFCVAEAGCKVSAMIAGNAVVIFYNDMEDLKRWIPYFLRAAPEAPGDDGDGPAGARTEDRR